MAKQKAKRRGSSLNPALDASKQKEFNQKIQEIKEKTPVEKSMPGVVYVSRLPWGFDEQPLRSFFSQFGTINKLRVSRSKKTGNSRGYAYIQFEHDEVAKIVAETMNNYLMFEKLIKCKHLSTVHPDTFKNANRQFFPFTTQEKAIGRHNLPKTTSALKRNMSAAKMKLKKKQAKLAELGIDYNLNIMIKLLSKLDPVITNEAACWTISNAFFAQATSELGTSQNKVGDDVKKVKEEIFSDDETLSSKSGKQKRKRKAETVSELGINDSSEEKTQKPDLKTAQTDVIHVSDKESSSKKEIKKTKAGKTKAESSSGAANKGSSGLAVKRKSPTSEAKLKGKKRRL